MFPKTEKELELYFLLIDLKLEKDNAEKSLWLHGTTNMRDMAEERYKRSKDEYLKKVNVEL